MEALYVCCNPAASLRPPLAPPHLSSPLPPASGRLVTVGASQSCGRRGSVVGSAVSSSSSSSSHSNPSIIKSTRVSPYRRRASAYGEDDDDDEEEEEDEEDDEEEETDSEYSSDVSLPNFAAF